MTEVLEDCSRSLTSLDFGVAVERAPSSAKLPLAGATRAASPSRTLEANEVIRAARREKHSLGWLVRTVLARLGSSWSALVDRALSVSRRTTARISPPAYELEESAATTVAPPPRRLERDVATLIVRKRTYRGSLTHDLRLDD